jgi:hypothetical protein
MQGEASPPPATASTSPPASSTAPAPSAAAISHPIGEAQSGPASASTAPLPALDSSDASVAQALGALSSGHLASLLIPGQIIPRIVATIDVLPRQGLGTFILPVHTAKGSLLTSQADGQTVIAAANAGRYAPYMRVVQSADPQALVGWYVREYPLFQSAYEQLGYPKGYFNDRLIEVIDNLLAAPDLAQPAPMVPVKAYYAYADPALESLSVGQKMLLRVGPANEAQIKSKLRAIRAALIEHKPAAAASSDQ